MVRMFHSKMMWEFRNDNIVCIPCYSWMEMEKPNQFITNLSIEIGFFPSSSYFSVFILHSKYACAFLSRILSVLIKSLESFPFNKYFTHTYSFKQFEIYIYKFYCWLIFEAIRKVPLLLWYLTFSMLNNTFALYREGHQFQM